MREPIDHLVRYARHLVLCGNTIRRAAELTGLSRSAIGRYALGISDIALKTHHPSKKYFGVTYFFEPSTGYFRSKSKYGGGYLHRAVYQREVGPIPDGFDVHHIDEDKNNNAKENLEPKSKHWHQKHHMAQRRAA
jgi:hypothetical protein